MNQLHDPVFWVAIAFLILVAAIGKPLWKFVTAALDKRSAQIAHDLEEAARLREEAQAILTAYQKKQQESLDEAERILQQTKTDAQLMAQKAEQDLKDSLEKRKALAMHRIEQAETKAMQAVQQHVVDIAVSAAKVVIAEQIASGHGQDLIRLATSDIEKKLH